MNALKPGWKWVTQDDATFAQGPSSRLYREEIVTKLRAEIVDLRAKLAARERAVAILREVAKHTGDAESCVTRLWYLKTRAASALAALDSGTPSDKGDE